MRIIFLLLFLWIPTALTAQTEGFNKRFHLGFNNLLFRSIELTDNCFIISGLGTTSYHGSVFAKFDFLGDPIDYQFNGSSQEFIAAYGNDLVRDDLTGSWIVSGEGADSTGGYSLVLVINQEGELIEKIKVYNPFYPKEGFISGSFAGIIPYDDGWALHANIVNPSTVPKSSDLYIVKFDGSFNAEWTKIIVNPLLSEGAFSLGQFAGNLLLGAWRTNVNFVQKNFKGQMYLVKLSPTGEVLKSFLYPATPSNQLLMGPADDMLVEEDGSLIVATRLGKEIVFGNNGVIFWDGQILKVNPSLNSIVWTQTLRAYQNSPLTQFYKVVKATEGDGYITAGVGVLDSIHMGALLGKVSTEGDSLWMRQYMYVTTSGCYNVIYDLESTPDGGYVMVGEARPSGSQDSLFPPPVQQGWILKVDEWGCLVPGCQLDVATKDAPAREEMRLKVYPNPASEVLYIHLPDAGPQGRFRLIDALGRTLREFAASQGDTTYILPLEGIPSGWYVLQYEEEGERRLAVSVYRV